MNEQRLTDIEIKLAHQEHALEEVNQAVTSQQAQLTQLERVCKVLAERLRTLADTSPEASAGDSGGDDRPPHY